MEDREVTERHARMLDLLVPSIGRGLEVGPLFDPVVLREQADVRYIDVHSAEVLRQHYADHAGLPLEDIVDPDFTLIDADGQVRTLPEAVAGAAPFDWTLASHVIEHVPDVIGWLSEVADVLADAGRLVLAVPDRRFSFDAGRPATTVGEMLLAHQRCDQRPSVRAVYDHYRYAVQLDARTLWTGASPGPGHRIHGLDYVLDRMALAERGTYVDCHVWLFTPASFVEQMGELGELDLFPFAIDKLVPTARNELEFYVLLRRLDRDLDSAGRAAARAGGITAWLDDEPGPRRGAGKPAAAQPPPRAGFAVSEREMRLIRAKRAVLETQRRLASGLADAARRVRVGRAGRQ